MFHQHNANPASWKGFTLVVPAVSVGNVGQLTADLLVSTMCMKKSGFFYDDSFLPVVGNDPFSPGVSSPQHCQLVTAVEVYESQEHKLVVIQQRSPFVKGKKKQFMEKLKKWVKEIQFSEVVIATSIFAHERLDAQLQGTQLRYAFSDKLEKKVGNSLIDSLGWVALERRPVLPGSDSDGQTELFMPGGGLAKAFQNMCIEDDILVGVVLKFCSEGDNAGDAVQLASYLNSWKGWVDLQAAPDILPPILREGWKIPSSWKLLFGNRFDQSLFH